MFKILITGGSGFIGHHLAKKLSCNNNVTIMDNLNNYYDVGLKNDRNAILSQSVEFVELDLTNKPLLDEHFSRNDYEVVVHLAAQAGVRYSFEEPRSYIENNILASFNLLECLKNNNIKHFLFSSTSSVYGYRDIDESFKETDETSKQLSLYASTKKSVETILHNYSHNFNIPSTVLRFFTVYGPWGRPDMALFKFVKSILNNEPIDVYNEGKMWRDFTYIDDLTESISLLINIIPNRVKICEEDNLSKIAPYRIVNIGNSKSEKLEDFIDTLEIIINKKALRNYLPLQAGDVPYTLSDISLLRKITGYSPNTSIHNGIKKFYEWYKNYYF